MSTLISSPLAPFIYLAQRQNDHNRDSHFKRCRNPTLAANSLPTGTPSRCVALSTLLAWTSFRHRLIGEQPEILIFSIRSRFDIGNNCPNPLQAIGAVGRTKQLGVRIQSIEDFDRTDAATGEEIRLSRNEVFAARQIKIGAENACGRGRSGFRLRTEQRQNKRESKTRRGHLNPSGSSR